MKNLFKGKIGTTVVILATLLLAGVAVFTALRLYQLRNQPVAPNVPSSFPRAQEATPPPATTCTLTFSLAATETPTGTPTSTPTGTPTETPTGTPSGTPTSTPTGTGTPRASVTPTPTQPSLPNSGTSWPTIVGAGIGILVILGSLLLAL